MYKIKLNDPQDYLLRISAPKYKATQSNGIKHFTAPSSSKKKPKLYALYDSNNLHYVGITNQPMASRLRYGLVASGRGGYHGYKWKDKKVLRLSVWTLAGADEEVSRTVLEKVEAETVFLYRKRTKRWPESQTEIHFHNDIDVDWRIPTLILDHITSLQSIIDPIELCTF